MTPVTAADTPDIRQRTTGLGGVWRVALRRSAGLYVLPLMLVLEAINALSRDRDWATEFSGTLNWSGSALILAAPLIAGAAAAESVTLRRHGAAELLGVPQARRQRFHAMRVAATALWCTLGHLLGTGLCLGFYLADHGWSLAQAPDPTLVPVLPSLALIWTATALGSLVGWARPEMLTPLLVAAGFYAVWLLLVLNGGEHLAMTSGTAATPIGFRVRSSLIAWQVIWFGSLAFAGTVWHVRPRGPARTAIASMTVLLVLGSGSVLWSLDSDVSEPDPGARARWICQGERPQVCVTSEFAAQLSSFDQAVRPVAIALARLGKDAPLRVEQRIDQQYQTPRAMPVALTARRDTELQQVTYNALLWASGCDDTKLDLDTEAWLNTEIKLAGWLTGEYAGDAAGAEEVRTAGPEQARRWLDQMRSCS
ncbi:MAG: hypothetical protein QG608_1500 [Actinomycetota bacterium]|nr:hypothetical protein [Actinomycetota bacterium]